MALSSRLRAALTAASSRSHAFSDPAAWLSTKGYGRPAGFARSLKSLQRASTLGLFVIGGGASHEVEGEARAAPRAGGGGAGGGKKGGWARGRGAGVGKASGNKFSARPLGPD